MSEATIALELKPFIPPCCSECNKATAGCFKIASWVIRGVIDSAEAGIVLRDELQENCGGEIIRPAGWGTTLPYCRYKEKP